MARIFWFISVLALINNGMAYPHLQVSDSNLYENSKKDSYMQVDEEESFHENLSNIQSEGIGEDEDEELAEQDYNIIDGNDETNIQDEYNESEDDYSVYVMETDKKAVNKAVDKILKRVDKFNKKGKRKPKKPLINQVGQAEDAELETLYNAAAEAAKKRDKTKKEIEEATKKMMIKKNKETYKAMIKIGMKIDKTAKKKGVEVPTVVTTDKKKATNVQPTKKP